MGRISRVVTLTVVVAAVFLALRSYAFRYSDVLNVALGLLALRLADLIVKVSWHVVPRRVLPSLHDKAVFITGCDRGFGNCLARKLDAAGVAVFAACLFPEGSGAAQLKKDCSSRLHVLNLDVTRDDHVRDAAASVAEALGDKKLWAVVNNAGIFVTGEAEYITTKEMVKMLDVNTVGSVRVTQAFLPLLRQSQGRVVFMASMAACITVPAMTTYAMSKSAIKSFAEGLRREMLKWSVSVHTIEPTMYRTDMADEEVIMKNVHNQWIQAPESVREDYGGDSYMQCFGDYMKIGSIFTIPKSRLHEVVDDMFDAAIGRNPKLRYVPGLFGQLMGWFVYNIPGEIVDFASYIALPISKKIKGRSVKQD